MKDITKYNYEELVDRITQMYQDKTGSGNGFEGNIGQMLIELLADTTDHLHFMLERRSQESFTTTARLESSIWMAASSIGYVPRRSVSSRGVLEMRLKDSNGNDVNAEEKVNISFGTPMTFDGQNFIVYKDASIDAGDNSTEIEVIEGTLERNTYNFSDEPYSSNGYFMVENYYDIDEFSLRIFGTNGDQYLYVNDVDENGFRPGDLSFTDGDYKGYDIRFTREGMRVIFGDDKFGYRPKSEITAEWINSSGSDVQIVQTGLSFTLESETIKDSRTTLPEKRYYYDLTNISPINGGSDQESIDEMRDNIAAFIRTNNRAVTNFDYNFWVRRSGIGDIADVNTYGEHETNRLIFTMNNVYIAYATSNGTELNTSQIRQLRDYINRVKVNTTHLVFKPVDRIFLGLEIDIQRHPSLPIANDHLYNVVKNSVYDYFKVRENSIGREFQHSEFVEYLQNLRYEFNGIRYPVTDFVKVKADGLMSFTIPQPAYDGVITVDPSYSIVANDIFNITIDGETYSVVTSSSDSISTMIDKMMNDIFRGTNLMLAKPAYNKIRISHPSDTGTYTISTGSGTITDKVTFKQFIQIPKPDNQYNPNIDKILPSSVKIVDESGGVYMEDNGSGSLVNQQGDYPTIEIDYNGCRVQNPSIPDRTYYVEFQQNQFQNFNIVDSGIIDVMPFREDEPESVHFFSKINLI